MLSWSSRHRLYLYSVRRLDPEFGPDVGNRAIYEQRAVLVAAPQATKERRVVAGVGERRRTAVTASDDDAAIGAFHKRLAEKDDARARDSGVHARIADPPAGPASRSSDLVNGGSVCGDSLARNAERWVGRVDHQ